MSSRIVITISLLGVDIGTFRPSPSFACFTVLAYAVQCHCFKRLAKNRKLNTTTAVDVTIFVSCETMNVSHSALVTAYSCTRLPLHCSLRQSRRSYIIARYTRDWNTRQSITQVGTFAKHNLTFSLDATRYSILESTKCNNTCFLKMRCNWIYLLYLQLFKVI